MRVRPFVRLAFQYVVQQCVDGCERHPFRLGLAGRGEGLVATQVSVQFRVGGSRPKFGTGIERETLRLST